MVNDSHEQLVYVKQIHEAVSTIFEFTKDIDRTQFLSDNKTIHACLMVLVHIGEIIASMQRHKIPIPFSNAEKIIGMRNFLAHQYLNIRPKLIEKTIYEDIPQLAQETQRLLFS